MADNTTAVAALVHTLSACLRRMTKWLLNRRKRMSDKEEERLNNIEFSIGALERLNSALQELEEKHFPKTCLGFITDFTTSLHVCNILCSGARNEEDKKQLERLDTELKKARDTLDQALIRTTYTRFKQQAEKSNKLESQQVRLKSVRVEKQKGGLQTIKLENERIKRETFKLGQQNAELASEAAAMLSSKEESTHSETSTEEDITQGQGEGSNGQTSNVSKLLIAVVDEIEQIKQIIASQEQQLDRMEKWIVKNEELNQQ